MGNTTIPAELVAINAISGTLIADNAITSVHIAENNITATQIAINAVTALQMADGTITSAKIADGTIVTADIADGQITTGKLADSSVTTGKIAAGTIASSDIANNAILTQHIDDNQITADQIADNAVGVDQLAGITRGSVLTGNAAGNPSLLALGAANTLLQSDGTDLVFAPLQSGIDDNSNAVAITIDSSEQVGIGSTNPTDKVQILDSGNLALRVESTGAGNQSAVWTENNAGSINGMFMYGASHSAYGAIGAGEGAFYSNTNINIMSDSSSGVIKLSTGSSGGAERMRIDSAGTMFFGTTTPTLHSAHRGIVFENGSLTNDITRGASKSMTLAQNLVIDSGNTWAYLATDEGSYYQQFGGNHYFGTTPSGSAGADATVTTRLHVRNDGGVAIGAGNAGYSSMVLSVKSGAADEVFYGESTDANCFAVFRDNSSNTNVAFGAIGNDHVFRNDGTEKWRMNASNGYLIGQSASQVRLVLGSTGNSSNNTSNWIRGTGNELGLNSGGGNIGIEIGGSAKATINTAGQILVNGGATTTPSFAFLNDTDTGMSRPTTNAVNFCTAGSERMRIDANGRVGIGGTSSGVGTAGLTVNNGDIRTTAAAFANHANSFSMSQESSGGTLCARGANGSTRGTIQLTVNKDNGGDGIVGLFIANDGNPCVGKTSSDINTQGFHIISSGTYAGTVYSGITGSTAGSTYHVRDTTNNAWKFYVTNAGVINATSTSITGLSDERLKENIVDLETGLSEVMSLKPRRFDWKEGEGSGAKNVAGFIAQEVETVLPDLIEDFMHDDLDDAKSIRMGDMLPTLIKAIQEQQAQIEILQREVQELKDNG